MAGNKNKPAPRGNLPLCKACDKPIHIPKGWSTGASVRRHYWRKHRKVMQKDGS